MSTSTVQIDKNIPLVRKIYGTRWPFAEMEVGDSFLVPDTVGRETRYVMAGGANQRLQPKRFTGRTVEGGTRIWRTA